MLSSETTYSSTAATKYSVLPWSPFVFKIFLKRKSSLYFWLLNCWSCNFQQILIARILLTICVFFLLQVALTSLTLYSYKPSWVLLWICEVVVPDTTCCSKKVHQYKEMDERYCDSNVCWWSGLYLKESSNEAWSESPKLSLKHNQCSTGKSKNNLIMCMHSC